MSRHAAQNEGRNRGRQVDPPGEPAGGDRAAVADHRQQVGQGRRSDGVDAGRPALLGERARRPGQLGAVDHLGGAEVLR